MSVQSPRTAREALLAEVLDEVDSLHRQVLALPDSLVAMEAKLAQTVSVLDQAADNFRMAVTAFSEQAKVDLLAFHERKTAQASSQILDEQRNVIHGLIATASQSTQGMSSQQIDLVATRVAHQLRRPLWTRLTEYTLVSLVTSASLLSLAWCAIKTI